MAEEKYEQGEDGLVREIVGEWALDKHDLLKRYIDISRHVRKQFLTGRAACASYIDLFCGPGQCRIRETTTIIDGSPVAAFKMAQAGGQPFSHIHLGDTDQALIFAACERIRRDGGNPTMHVGSAERMAQAAVSSLNSYGLHFALLDPYRLGGLSFDIIRTLGKLDRIDMLLHISAMDLQRNLDAYAGEGSQDLDTFAPGWRGAIDHKAQGQQATRAAILNHWSGLVEGLGFAKPRYELISGSRSQRLYWLAFISRKPIANDFWEKIRYTDGQNDLLSGL